MPHTTASTPATKSRSRKRSAPAAANSLVEQLADALQRPRTSKDRYVGVRNISNYVIDIANPIAGQPSILSLHSDFIDPVDPTKFVSNPNACQVVPHAVWMQLRRGSLYDRGMIVRDDTILGTTYEAAEPDQAHELAAGWAKNAVLDSAAFIAQKDEGALRAAIDAMTSEESLRRLLTAVNQRVELERLRIGANGTDARLEERAFRNMPAIYHLAEELVLDRLEQLGYR